MSPVCCKYNYISICLGICLVTNMIPNINFYHTGCCALTCSGAKCSASCDVVLLTSVMSLIIFCCVYYVACYLSNQRSHGENRSGHRKNRSCGER
jgi:hypothetical protein